MYFTAYNVKFTHVAKMRGDRMLAADPVVLMVLSRRKEVARAQIHPALAAPSPSEERLHSQVRAYI